MIDNIPLPAHDGGVASYASLSFDSEIGYGEKVAGGSRRLKTED